MSVFEHPSLEVWGRGDLFGKARAVSLRTALEIILHPPRFFDNLDSYAIYTEVNQRSHQILWKYTEKNKEKGHNWENKFKILYECKMLRRKVKQMGVC